MPRNSLPHAPWHYRHFGAGVQIHEYCVILRPEVISIADGARIDSHCKLEGGLGLSIGRNVHVASFCHLNAGGGTVILGDHSGYASHVVICGGATDYTASLAVCPQDGGATRRAVTVVGEYVVVFAGAVILPGITIGDRAIVAAGAVVTKDVAPWAIVAGVPARKIGERRVGDDIRTLGAIDGGAAPALCRGAA
jgi:galactoside O-acetyltransferase